MVSNISPKVLDIVAHVRIDLIPDIPGRRYLVFAVGIPLAIYLAYPVIGIGGATDQSIGGVAWPSRLMVSMAAFGAMSAAVSVAAGTWRGTSRASPSGPVLPDVGPGANANLPVRALSAMGLALPPVILIGLAGAAAGVRLQGVDWLVLATSLWLGAVPFVVLGVLLGLLLDADNGDVVLLCVLVLLAILGGFFQPIETLPADLAGLARVLPSYRLADLGWTAIATRTADPVDVLVLAGYTFGFGVVALWRKRSEDAQVGG